MAKEKRQQKIMEIISGQEIRTQKDLMDALRREGIRATQATVSRDIREMHLRKVTLPLGRQKYAPPKIQTSKDESYRDILSGGILSMETAGDNIIVLRTNPGVAMAVGAAIDSRKPEGVVGCIAGDDTVFVAVKAPGLLRDIMQSLMEAF